VADETFFDNLWGRKKIKYHCGQQPARQVKAPIIDECVAHMECKVRQEIETGDKKLFAHPNGFILQVGGGKIVNYIG
jgi:flavin reductase (DIM6/NTAB) family NADH-FMN oxidoreductase RutF